MHQHRRAQRYESVPDEKSDGAVYTPRPLADFVARKIVAAFEEPPRRRPLRILDPALGDGELLMSLLAHIRDRWHGDVEVCGFETDTTALQSARTRVEQAFPDFSVCFEHLNFLDSLPSLEGGHSGAVSDRHSYDLIVANPPYVRTQVLGTKRAQLLCSRFGLSGRVDLYYPFLLGMSQVLARGGVAGVIVSNRFMTTKSGASVRKALLQRFEVRHVWDLGDTKLFNAAVLPAVLLLGKARGGENARFTTIYSTKAPATGTAADSLSALNEDGVIEVDDGRIFRVQQGRLHTSGKPDGVWRVATRSSEAWLENVERHTWNTFGDIGKVRVGVKTCADKVFVRNDWEDMPATARPELLRPLLTHHSARRFKPLSRDRPSYVLYPHEVVGGCRRAVRLADHPRSLRYLSANRPTLEARRYLAKAGREWYEIWVPQDPDAWAQPKLVFPDISEQPTFWLDFNGSVVNGDCYWLTTRHALGTDLLWLAAAVANSSFAERFYDLRFNNKLYAGRRRFITQYVEAFPLPNPQTPLSKVIVATAKRIYGLTPSTASIELQVRLDTLVWDAFESLQPRVTQQAQPASLPSRRAPIR